MLGSMKKSRLIVVVSVLAFFLVTQQGAAGASAGQKCPRAGALSGTTAAPLICQKVGNKLVWKSTKKATPSTTSKETVSQINAKRSAKNYLGVLPFSRSGLIKQLEYEGFSSADAIYGVDAQNADWNAQASKSANQYLKSMAFSRSGLIDQLIYEGFTQAQAEYGVNTTGL